MHNLNTMECTQISGGNQLTTLVIITMGVMGGLGGKILVETMGPISPAVGVPLGAIGLGMICTPFAPGAGTVLCGIGGGYVGYHLSASVATVGAVLIGGGAAAALGFMSCV